MHSSVTFNFILRRYHPHPGLLQNAASEPPPPPPYLEAEVNDSTCSLEVAGRSASASESKKYRLNLEIPPWRGNPSGPLLAPVPSSPSTPPSTPPLHSPPPPSTTSRYLLQPLPPPPSSKKTSAVTCRDSFNSIERQSEAGTIILVAPKLAY